MLFIRFMSVLEDKRIVIYTAYVSVFEVFLIGESMSLVKISKRVGNRDEPCETLEEE